jgi:DNA-binding MurR/RpiR family transcriptional regulator
MRSLAIQVGSATELLEEAQLDATVADLRRAHRVLVVAGGLSASVGSALTARLLRAGITTLMPTDPLDVELVAATLDPGDVCIAVSASGAHAGTLHTARTAQAQGARVIALSAFAQTPLEQFADRTHVTPVPDRHFRDELHTPSRLALHALVEALSTVMDAAADIGSHERLLEVVSSHVDE